MEQLAATQYAYIVPDPDNPGRYLAYASETAHRYKDAPLGRVLTYAHITTPRVHFVRHKSQCKAFVVRVETPDGRLWSGRSTGGLPSVTLRELVPDGPVAKYLHMSGYTSASQRQAA